MQPEDPDAAHLWDILEAARTVREFTADVDLDGYLDDRKLQLAVERELEIIGEAARKVSDAFKQAHPQIPWAPMIGQRNVLAHQYGRIDQKRLWQVAATHIPALIAMVEPLMPPLPPEVE